MTPESLRTARTALGKTQRGMALALGVEPRSYQRWEDGDRTVPETVQRVVRLALDEAGMLDRLEAKASRGQPGVDA